MRAAEFVFSTIVAFAVVYVLFQNQSEKMETLTSSKNGYTFTFSTIPTIKEDTAIIIPVTLTGPVDTTARVWFRNLNPNQDTLIQLYRYTKTPLSAVHKDSAVYEMLVQTGEKLNVLRYYFELRDQVGRELASITRNDNSPLVTRVIGDVDSWIKYGYFLTMFLSILYVAKGAIESVTLTGGKGQAGKVKKSFLTGLIFGITSAVLLRSWFGLQLDGNIWQAVPFGADLKDNLQLILIFYLLLLVVLTGKRHLALPKRVIGILGILAFFITIAAYLLPVVLNSIDIPIEKVTYSVIAVFAIAILLSLRAARRAQ